MTFASPLWLIGLLPWLGVALYLLWGRRKRRDVPFLELWRGPAAVEHIKWKVSAPPLALPLALLALLTAILGAARPGARWAAGDHSIAVTVVLDRGMTMSARGANDLRFREAGRDAADEIAHVFGPGAPIEAWVVPALPTGTADTLSSTRFASPHAWLQSLDRLPPTAIDSADAVRQKVRRALAGGTGPVVVVSDAVIGIDDPRVVQVTPRTTVRNVGIALFSARETPRPQVMVRVQNDSPMRTATLEVSFGNTGDAPVRRAIDLPPAGGDRDFFVDAQRLGPIVSVALIAPDDLQADNKAWLVRESTWPRVELSRPAGALSRLVYVYGQLHPPGEGSRLVRVVSQVDELGPGESGIVIEPGMPDGSRTVRPTRIVPHPITDSVRNWPSLDLPGVDGKPPADWTAVLSAGDQTLVAVHESSGPAAARQVWVGLDPAGWAQRPQYVAFWAAAFDWAGGVGSQGERYVSYPLDRFDPSWKPRAGTGATHDPGTWPGLYQRADGAWRAYNAPPPHITEPAPVGLDWRKKLTSLRLTGPGFRNFSAGAMLAAMAFVLLAAATWRKAPTGRGPYV